MLETDSDLYSIYKQKICQDDQIKFNEYTLGKELGKGAFGTTYMAKKNGDDRTFVLKILNIRNPNKIVRGSLDLASIHSEINILQKISKAKDGCTKDILCYYDHFIDCTDPDLILMVIVTLAFENAISLESFIKKNVLDVTESLEIEIDNLMDEKNDIIDEIEEIEDEDEDQNETELLNLKEQLKSIEKKLIIKQENLEDNLRITPLPHNVLLKIFFNILKAMYHLEKLGIGHGDIKTDNILINPNTYDIQIIDFGTACVNNNCKVSGTLLYNSPELLYHLRHTGGEPYTVENLQSSDVFSLGIVFYKLANGRFPFLKDDLLYGSDLRIIDSLLEYYKKNITTNIFSMYNENTSSFDQKINKFIESMLSSKESRPKVSSLLPEIQNLLDEYNTMVKNKKLLVKTSSPVTSPVKYTPVNTSPVKSPKKNVGLRLNTEF